MEKRFSFTIPRYVENLNTGKPVYAGDLEIIAIAKLYQWDGTLRTVDIDVIIWVDIRGRLDVTRYIAACHPDTWQEIVTAAENYYRNT
jgi:hypothetical protein